MAAQGVSLMAVTVGTSEARIAAERTRRPERAQTAAQQRGQDVLAGLELAALVATRAAALACQPHVGSGDAIAADAAATAAMRRALASAPGSGVVVIGEGEKDGAPMLFNGEHVGDGVGPEFDVAVDPLEGTKLCARGLGGAMTTIACSAPGPMWSPGPAFYMDKLVVGARARGAIDITLPPERNLANVAEALGKRVAELRVVILDKPRHAELIATVQSLGATVTTPGDGDVAGALASLLPDGDSDLLMGIGGTPEGVMTACAVRALGGDMQGRLAPQTEHETRRLNVSGADIERPLALEDLVDGPSFFAATGVTTGGLLRGPWQEHGAGVTESLLTSRGAIRRILETTPPDSEREPPAALAARPRQARRPRARR